MKTIYVKDAFRRAVDSTWIKIGRASCRERVLHTV